MPLGFLAPAFFAGLIALAVPIIVHLIQKQRKEAVQFPSLMFLRQVPYKSTRRRRIRNWPLFLLRCAALILLIAAFARPFVDRDNAAVGNIAPARELVVLLDRSYSMGYGDRWVRARAAALAAIEEIAESDRATVVLFDGGASAANQPTSDRVRLRAAIDSAQVGSGITRYGPALKLAQSLLEASDLPRREVVLITDFQRVGWDGESGARLPAGATITPIQIGEEQTANVSVTGVTFRREYVGGRERVTATARLTNKGGEGVGRLPVTLELNGREIQTQAASIAADDAGTVTFAPFTLSERNTRGTVRAAADGLPKDNAFHFALSPGQAISVLVVNGGSVATSLYMTKALSIGEQPSFTVETRQAGQLRAADIADRSVIVLNDAPFPAGEAGRRLKAFVQGGGGLIVGLGDHAGANGWGEGAELLPGTPGRVVDRTDGGGGIGYIDYSSPIFELFRTPRSGDFSSARFFRYRPVTLEGTDGVLARYDDGAPALVERKVGDGTVLLWASSFDNFWNDLALQPIFLPFVHRMVAHAAAYSEPSPWFTAGQVLDVTAWNGRLPTSADTVNSEAAASEGVEAAHAAQDIVTTAPSGERLPIDTSGLLRLEEQGFYEIRSGQGDRRDFSVAVNLDLAESDLSTMDPLQLALAVEPRDDAAARTRPGEAISVQDKERRQSLWWYLLIGVFILLAAETVWSNRLSWRRRTEAT